MTEMYIRDQNREKMLKKNKDDLKKHWKTRKSTMEWLDKTGRRSNSFHHEFHHWAHIIRQLDALDEVYGGWDNASGYLDFIFTHLSSRRSPFSAVPGSLPSLGDIVGSAPRMGQEALYHRTVHTLYTDPLDKKASLDVASLRNDVASLKAALAVLSKKNLRKAQGGALSGSSPPKLSGFEKEDKANGVVHFCEHHNSWYPKSKKGVIHDSSTCTAKPKMGDPRRRP